MKFKDAKQLKFTKPRICHHCSACEMGLTDSHGDKIRYYWCNKHGFQVYPQDSCPNWEDGEL